MVFLSSHLQSLHVKQPHRCAHCVSENTKVVHGKTSAQPKEESVFCFYTVITMLVQPEMVGLDVKNVDNHSCARD